MSAASTTAVAKDGPIAAVARVIRQVIGVPDYDRYLAHFRVAHPGCEPVSQDAFMRERLEERYSRPGSKCC